MSWGRLQIVQGTIIDQSTEHNKVLSLRRVSNNTMCSSENMSGIKEYSTTKVASRRTLQRDHERPISNLSIFTSDHIPYPERSRGNCKQNLESNVKRISVIVSKTTLDMLCSHRKHITLMNGFDVFGSLFFIPKNSWYTSIFTQFNLAHWNNIVPRKICHPGNLNRLLTNSLKKREIQFPLTLILHKCICTISVNCVKCGIRSTLCWKIGNISGSTELFGL